MLPQETVSQAASTVVDPVVSWDCRQLLHDGDAVYPLAQLRIDGDTEALPFPCGVLVSVNHTPAVWDAALAKGHRRLKDVVLMVHVQTVVPNAALPPRHVIVTLGEAEALRRGAHLCHSSLHAVDCTASTVDIEVVHSGVIVDRRLPGAHEAVLVPQDVASECFVAKQCCRFFDCALFFTAAEVRAVRARGASPDSEMSHVPDRSLSGSPVQVVAVLTALSSVPPDVRMSFFAATLRCRTRSMHSWRGTALEQVRWCQPHLDAQV